MVMFQWDARHWETVKQLENSFKGINSHGNVIIFVLADTRQQALTVALVAGAGKSYYECGSNNSDWLRKESMKFDDESAEKMFLWNKIYQKSN